MKRRNKEKVSKKTSSDQSFLGYFFNNCSIRGVSKAYKTNSIIIKIVWIIFIILMFVLLFNSIIKIVREYLEYNTTIQTKLEIGSASLFPAITFCPYQPFSQRAIKFFEKGGMSPKNFSQKLRKAALKSLMENDPEKAEFFIFYDDLRIYYQNLEHHESTYIGLNASDIFVFCITKLTIGMFFGKVDSNCGYIISRYSTPDFFNCFTINMKPNFSKDTDYIHLILRFPKPQGLHKYRETSLLKTLSQNIIGAQLIVHEANSSPAINKEKIHIEPNRLLQINFQTNQWKEYNTPNDICKSEHSEQIKDLDNNYSFSFAGCLAAYNAKKILEQCGCVMAFLPRSVIPSPKFPYCANFRNLTDEGFNQFKKQTVCLTSVLRSLERMSSSEKNCYKRCEDQRFTLQTSSINWKPDLLQLEWLYKLQESWNTLIELPENDSRKVKAKQVAKQFLNANSISDLVNENEESIFRADENYACVVLERLSNDTLYKEERLGLSLYGLVSRIGGSCTLYLGLTCAFIIEIVEFLIYFLKSRPLTSLNMDENCHYENPSKNAAEEYEKDVIINPENEKHLMNIQFKT